MALRLGEYVPNFTADTTNWRPGDDCIIGAAVTDEATGLFPRGVDDREALPAHPGPADLSPHDTRPLSKGAAGGRT